MSMKGTFQDVANKASELGKQIAGVGTKVSAVARKVRGIDQKTALATIGLEKRKSTFMKVLPFVGTAVGALVAGATLALLLPTRLQGAARSAVHALIG